MSRHRSPRGRRASLPLLSPQFAVAGAGSAGGYRAAGPHVRHARGSSAHPFPLQSRSSRVTAAVLAVGGVAVTAHMTTQGTPFPDADEVTGWFTAADAGTAAAAVPAPRTAPDATIADGTTLASLASSTPAPSAAATALTGAVPAQARTAGAVSQARESVRGVREAAAAKAAATPPARPAASAAAAGGAMQILSGRVTSGFGSRWGTSHQGLDIAAPIGTPIYVPMAGTVISSGPASGFGLWVRVQHADGTVTTYGHINRSLVKVGQKVSAGQQIAEVGNRGQSTGPHLHLEVTEGGKKINPQPWLAEHGFRVT